ncbi:MAG: 3-methyl-2-oxobutanoate hydroxymethyltransferase [Leptothrix sp. (in: b-proteobacteria)]
MSSHAQPTAPSGRRKPVSLQTLREMHARSEPIAMLTAYDATLARVADDAGIDTLLVGDSLGNVIQGHTSTLPVSLDEMVYHTRCVARGLTAGGGAAFLIADLPFGSYQESAAQALRSSAALMQAGAQMVKLEGGGWTPEIVRLLVERGMPVCAHLGLTPQSVHALGGFRVQGRDEAGAATLRRHAKELADAGAAMLVLELMPSAVAASVQADNPGLITIGIGAGAGTAGQVLVQHDMLGLTRSRLPRFVRNFMLEGGSVEDAMRRYVAAVKAHEFPNEAQHGY